MGLEARQRWVSPQNTRKGLPCCIGLAVFSQAVFARRIGRGWREIFKDYDYDGSGQMDLQEFRHASAPLC